MNEEHIEKTENHHSVSSCIKEANLPNGTELRGKYKGYYYKAKFENGTLLLKDKKFESLSAAAVSITREPVINGLNFWEFKKPNGSWVCFSGL